MVHHLTLLWFLQIFLRCSCVLREDQQEWGHIAHSIIDTSVAANRSLLQLIGEPSSDEDSSFGEDIIDEFLSWSDQVPYLILKRLVSLRDCENRQMMCYPYEWHIAKRVLTGLRPHPTLTYLHSKQLAANER